MRGRGCLLSPVTMVTSQPAAARPTIMAMMSEGFLMQVGVIGLKPGDVLAEPITSPGAPSRMQGSLQTRLRQNSLRNVA